MEAHLNRQMIAISQKVIVLTDSTKFGKKGFGRICGLEEVDHIITDNNVPEFYKTNLESMGIEVTVV
jgi:DeoR family transcriptional regulator of aga operon